jgi:hypothetical protein
MKVIEIGDIRKYWIESSPDADFDNPYTFYYDETNNLKKFHVRESDFNVSFDSNFILGGIVFEKSSPNLSNLFERLNLQKSVKDVKLKHLAKGTFLECLKSKKLNLFLLYLVENKISVHFTWVNLLYWSLTDIVDSAVANSEIAMKVGRVMIDKVKNDLYALAKLEIEAVIKLFYKYQYPNIKKESIVSFIKELTTLFYGYIETEEFHFGLESLRQILKEATEKQSLPFLTHEEDYILLKDFSQFYLSRLYLFKNSNHIFDNEESVSEIIGSMKIMDGMNEIKNYSFVNSESNQFIQASDIFVGLIGKLSGFLNTSSYNFISVSIGSLSDIQKTNLDLIIDLIERSAEKNPAFIISIDSREEKDKYGLIQDLRNKY